jgi:tetratricopeptide (TPR) repeat protein
MPAEPNNLDPKISEAIQTLSTKGDDLAEAGAYKSAIAEYNKAWALVPEPKNNWEASTWILTAIADACFLAGYFTSARKALGYAMTCPCAIGNPFLHLRYGQVLFEAGDHAQAVNELMRAYMGAGTEIFANDDPKYLDFLKKRAAI